MDIPIPSPNLLVIAPALAVVITALLVMVVDLFLSKGRKQLLAWLSLVGVLLASGLVYYIWDGANPVLDDMLASDGYALFMQMVVLAAAALAILLSAEHADRTGLPQGEYYTLLLLAAAGMMLMTAAINLITIFIALEMLSVALYVLTGMNRADARSAEAALKYLLLGALASGFLLFGMALVYGQVGTTSLAGVRAHVLALNGQFPALLLVGLGLMLAGLSFKIALVPFHMWTPDVYEGAPAPVSAFMSVGAKVAGVAALGRIAVYALGDMRGDWHAVLAGLAALTMTVGNLAALRQTNLKRMLAYSGIAHAGYIVAGLAAGNELGTAGVLFYLFAYAFMNVGAFAVVIAVSRWHGASQQGETLDALAGLGRRKPALAAAMALCMLSLTGLPPLAGFVGKLYIFSATVQAGLIWLAIVGVLNSVLAAYYYLRVVAGMYLNEQDRAGGVVCPALAVGLAIASVMTVVLGVWPTPILVLARSTLAALFGG
jgi:NADH-quinone oxidoreductase subunit N